MKNELDCILKNEILDDCMDSLLEKNFVHESGDGSAVKVYGKLAGLSCIGRTCFTTLEELNAKNEDAQTQMMQKYGAETYGSSAQLKQ